MMPAFNDDDQDGSLALAVEAMPDLDPPVQDKPARQRGDNGRFAKAEADKAEKAGNSKPADQTQKTAKTEKVESATEPAAEEEEDFVEWPAEEEGAEPQRYKLSDVFAGFRERDSLKAELEQARATPSQALPAEVDRYVSEAMQEKARYADALQNWLAWQRPKEPSIDLTNPASERYNPEEYHRQHAAYTAQIQQIRAVAGEFERVRQENEAHATEMATRTIEREKALLHQHWPEIKDKAVQAELTTFLDKNYGIGRDVLNAVTDHRLYRLARDAMEGAKAKAKAEAAVKVVTQKPKLVKGSSQSVRDQKSARTADAMTRLQKSGSIDDAADALAGLLN